MAALLIAEAATAIVEVFLEIVTVTGISTTQVAMAEASIQTDVRHTHRAITTTVLLET